MICECVCAHVRMSVHAWLLSGNLLQDQRPVGNLGTTSSGSLLLSTVHQQKCGHRLPHQFWRVIRNLLDHFRHLVHDSNFDRSYQSSWTVSRHHTGGNRSSEASVPDASPLTWADLEGRFPYLWTYLDDYWWIFMKHLWTFTSKWNTKEVVISDQDTGSHCQPAFVSGGLTLLS